MYNIFEGSRSALAQGEKSAVRLRMVKLPYLIEKSGIMPTQVISLRIDTELLEYLKERAEREHRTLTNMIISILLDEKEREGKA